MVIGRVVSMEKGRPTIVTPIGRTRTSAENDLLAAALNWKKNKDKSDPSERRVALARLIEAAENI